MGGNSEPDHGQRGHAARLLTGIGALLVLIGFAAWSVLSLHPPDPAGAEAPADSFSADRAMTHVDRMAQVPHPTGTQANDDVRAYILGRLRSLGLDPHVNSALGIVVRGPDRVNAADVDNVVAVVPGTDPTGQLFLTAHYDSAQFAPGAGDDASGAATILEIARALVDGPPLRNDIVLLFTDAEESGTIGSEAFIDSDPLAADGGVVLNFEARGSSGPVVMFETSDGNAELTRLYADTVPHPAATSAAVEVYRRLRNNTDFTNFLTTLAFTGMNSAFFDGAAVYHTPQDVPSRLSGASLQAMGDNGLALTHALGETDLEDYAHPADHDATYFPLLGAVAHYPGWWVWPLAALSVVSTVTVAAIAWRKGVSSPLRLAAGWLAAVVPLIVAPLATYGLWRLLVLVRPGYGSTLDLWRPAVLRVAVVALVVTVFLAFLALARRRIGTSALVFGCLVWLTILGIVLAALAPGASYLTALPALATGIAAAIALTAPMPLVRLAVALAGAVFGVVVLTPAVSMFFASLGMPMAAGSALFIMLLCFAAAPALDLLFIGPTADVPAPARIRSTYRAGPADRADQAGQAGHAWHDPHAPKADEADRPPRTASAAVPLATLVATAVLVAVGMTVDAFDAHHPEPAQLIYALDADTGSAHWLSENPPTDYTRQFLDSEADVADYFPFAHPDKGNGPLEPADVATYYPYIHQKVHVGPAKTADVPAPSLEVLADSAADDVRTITLRVAPRRPVRLITVGVKTPGTIEGVRIGDRELTGAAVGSPTSAVTFHGPAADGVTLTYRISGGGPVRLRAVDGSDGLGDLPGFVPPPQDVDIAGTHSSDLLLVATQKTLD